MATKNLSKSSPATPQKPAPKETNSGPYGPITLKHKEVMDLIHRLSALGVSKGNKMEVCKAATLLLADFDRMAREKHRDALWEAKEDLKFASSARRELLLDEIKKSELTQTAETQPVELAEITKRQLNDIANDLRAFVQDLQKRQKAGSKIAIDQITGIQEITLQLEGVIDGAVPKFWYVPQAGRVPAAVALSSVKEGLSQIQMTLIHMAGAIDRENNHLGTMTIDSHGQACIAAAFAPEPGTRQRQSK